MRRPAIVDDTPEDARWRRLHDAALVGESIDPDDAAFLDDHAPIGDLAREERRVLAAIAGLLGDDPVEVLPARDDEALIAAAIDQVYGAAPRAIGGDEGPQAARADGAAGLAGPPADAAAPRSWGPGASDLAGARTDEADADGPARVAAASGPPIDLDARRRRRGAWIGRGALALAAAAALALWTRPFGQVSSDMVQRTAEKIAAATASEGPLRLLSGALVGDDAPMLGGPLGEPLGETIASAPLVSRGRACVGVPGLVQTCLEDQAKFRARGRTIEVIEGRAETTVLAPAVHFAWTAVGAYAIVSDGAGAYQVIVEGDRWEVRSESAALHVDGPGGALTLAAGETRRSDEAIQAPEGDDSSGGDGQPNAPDEGSASAPDDGAAPPDDGAAPPDDGAAPPVPPDDRGARPTKTGRPAEATSAAALLREAQSLRAAGSPAAAARAYKKVIAADPKGPLARTSQVALGQLYLGPLADPKAAIRAFDAYLGGGDGAMSEEALHGKIVALDRLRKREAADAAAAEFLRRFPTSRYAAALRGR
ncbi:MAG: hypothetical protein R3B09_20660 [Nannocystaceae bacterium]